MLSSVKMRYGELSRAELVRHIGFCARALAADRSIDVILPDGRRIPVRKRVRRTKPDLLEIQFSSGHLGQDAVQTLFKVFETEGVEFRVRYAPKRGHISRIVIPVEMTSPVMANYIGNLITLVLQTITGSALSFEIQYMGSFDDSYQLSANDPVAPTLSFRIGQALGYFLGRLVRWLHGTNKKT